jgi:hypothetical protein
VRELKQREIETKFCRLIEEVVWESNIAAEIAHCNFVVLHLHRDKI